VAGVVRARERVRENFFLLPVAATGCRTAIGAFEATIKCHLGCCIAFLTFARKQTAIAVLCSLCKRNVTGAAYYARASVRKVTLIHKITYNHDPKSVHSQDSRDCKRSRSRCCRRRCCQSSAHHGIQVHTKDHQHTTHNGQEQLQSGQSEQQPRKETQDKKKKKKQKKKKKTKTKTIAHLRCMQSNFQKRNKFETKPIEQKVLPRECTRQTFVTIGSGFQLAKPTDNNECQSAVEKHFNFANSSAKTNFNS
jgi:hypothetical protein